MGAWAELAIPSRQNGMGENETDWLVGIAHACVTYE